MTQIVGNPTYIPETEFKPKIERCLKLLKEKASAYSQWFELYNLKISAARASGANFADGSVDIARETFNSTETWLASVIIHEAIHFWQYRSGKYKAGQNAEAEANIYQMGVLQLIGAPSSEIQHMKAQDGNHFDLDGDGKYTEKDYKKRGY